jgi:hypothetical protein
LISTTCTTKGYITLCGWVKYAERVDKLPLAAQRA